MPRHIHFLRQHFALDWHGAHGASHWARVRQNGLLIARNLDVRTDVKELFAFLHDAERKDEYGDLGHGPRAAELIRLINGDLVNQPHQLRQDNWHQKQLHFPPD